MKSQKSKIDEFYPTACFELLPAPAAAYFVAVLQLFGSLVYFLTYYALETNGYILPGSSLRYSVVATAISYALGAFCAIYGVFKKDRKFVQVGSIIFPSFIVGLEATDTILNFNTVVRPAYHENTGYSANQILVLSQMLAAYHMLSIQRLHVYHTWMIQALMLITDIVAVAIILIMAIGNRLEFSHTLPRHFVNEQKFYAILGPFWMYLGAISLHITVAINMCFLKVFNTYLEYVNDKVFVDNDKVPEELK